MDESSVFVVDQDITTSPLNLVLVGRKGNGKSATGNSILGTNVFRSERISSGLTNNSDLKTTTLQNGQMLNVIDTPGLFDSSVSTSIIAKEIINCINMAGDGIHAFLVVFSVRSRFSKEEESVISSLIALFGRKIYDYIIVVYTGGDVLDEEDETLEDFLSDCPETLKETLHMCGNRCVLFDNKSKEQTKRARQLDELLSHVNVVSANNGGKPYTNVIFAELKEQAKTFQGWETKHHCGLGISGLKDQKHLTKLGTSGLKDRMREDQFKQMVEMVEQNLKATTLSLERQLAEDHAARVKAEEDAEAIQKKLNEEKNYMNVELMQKETTLNHGRQLAEEYAAQVKAKEDEAIKAQLDMFTKWPEKYLCMRADNKNHICVIL